MYNVYYTSKAQSTSAFGNSDATIPFKSAEDQVLLLLLLLLLPWPLLFQMLYGVAQEERN